MRQEKIILLLVVIVVILSIMFITGIGYAVETDRMLKISDNALLVPEQTDFKIAFTGVPTYKGEGCATLKITGTTTATMNITELESVGDTVICSFQVKNESDYLQANINTQVTNTNTEYFKVTSSVLDNNIKPKGGKSTIEVAVELIKSPINKVEKTAICIKIFATPQ